jgi:hypothetical protein
VIILVLKERRYGWAMAPLLNVLYVLNIPQIKTPKICPSGSDGRMIGGCEVITLRLFVIGR